MGDVNLEIKLGNLDERVIKIEESGGGSGGDGYITSVSNDFNVVNKKLSLSNDVTTKLSMVDTTDNLSVELAKKIDKPASATDGQVLTYNGTSEQWEAQNSQGGSITEPTDLEKGIIGGDEYSPTETYGIDAGLKNICIYNNKIYSAIKNSFSNVLPTDIDYWKETSISELNSSLPNIEIGSNMITFSNNASAYIHITFTKQFSTTPVVFCSSGHGRVIVSASAVTKNGFNAIGNIYTGTALNENISFSYMAFEQ